MTREETLSHLLDQLLCLWASRTGFAQLAQYRVVHDALQEIVRARTARRAYPITRSLSDYLVQQGWLPTDDEAPPHGGRAS